MEQAQKDRKQLQEHVDRLGDGLVKTHMLKALAELDAILAKEATEDPLVVRIRSRGLVVKQGKDALGLIVHLLLQDAGFVSGTATTERDALYVPSDWDKNATEGIYIFNYQFQLRRSTRPFVLKALYIGNTLAVHITDENDKVTSIELNAPAYIRDLTATNANAADVVQNMAALRQQWTSFVESFLPKDDALGDVPPMRRPEPGYPRMPSVGRGDIMPDFGMGGHRDPGMLVGPNHPLFGGPPAFQGSVPGARFDPYGPVGPRPMHPFPNQPSGRAPRQPFGGPDPDHLRMPGDRDPNVDHMFF
ncbi:hypothetical protein SPRG_08044 [Saprolegnia parasitica CBS 223.65]|uniref:PI31 proteasome regulator N-terminal domain-containing protein n=1 Tax=Saprolegnia parasitica (strain CBS 223.65) TaxID=695850 RepID=A0A067CBT6_SAPPC|nr:hypothetical protein SPRG_08044 [Saprolegnia parasitica CBS 223.65]KDO26640.1 hypothetical protein SPRG_08044 [Saprolegnia parasitica CBS 223.65]|eukprot:XP_012202779.1 hypothetical protein SPRG_08044 [Saprolegnia parasitica CBS 223.65]